MMWLQKPGIVNTPSDGSERAVGNGLYAVIECPADDAIAEIRFKDWSKHMPQYGQYTPVIYGYNKYGQLIDTDVSGYTLTAPAELGTIDDGTLLADGSGCHALTATLGELTASIPVNIVSGGDVVFGLDKMLIDNLHSWQIEPYTTVNGVLMPLAPKALTWSSDAPEVVSVDSEGRLTAYTDGTAIISGSVGDFSASIELTVECPRAEYMNLPIDLSQWSVKGTGATATLSALGSDGLAIDYNVTSTRNPTVTLTPAGGARLWSVPDALYVELNVSGQNIVKENITLRPNNGRNTAHTIDDLAEGSHCQTLPVSLFVDDSDLSVWPLTLVSFTFTLKSGSGRIELPRIATVHNGYSGIENVPVTDNSLFDPATPVVYYNMQGIRIDKPEPGQIVIRRQGSRAEKVIIR